MVEFSEYRKRLLSEMAIRNRIVNSGTVDKSRDWDWYRTNPMYLNLVQEKIGSKHYKVYKVGYDAQSYFLVSEKNDYIGNVSGILKGKTFYIDTTHADKSKISKGFYQIIFGVMLSNKIDEILSDSSLSDSAIKSYNKLSTVSGFKVRVRVSKGKYLDFNKENLFSDGNNLVSIRNGYLKERFKKYYETLRLEYEGGLSSSLFRMYESYDEDVDGWLFGEMIEDEL